MLDAHTLLFSDSTSTSDLIEKQRGCIVAVLRDQCRGCVLTGCCVLRVVELCPRRSEPGQKGMCWGFGSGKASNRALQWHQICGIAVCSLADQGETKRTKK